MSKRSWDGGFVRFIGTSQLFPSLLKKPLDLLSIYWIFAWFIGTSQLFHMFLKKPLHLLSIYWIYDGFIGTSQLFHMFLKKTNEWDTLHPSQNIGFIGFIGTVQAFIGILLDLLGRLSYFLHFWRNRYIYWAKPYIFKDTIGFAKESHTFEFFCNSPICFVTSQLFHVHFAENH